MESYFECHHSTTKQFIDGLPPLDFRKRDFQIYKFPLVWVEPLLKDNRHCVRVYAPEDELHVEFNDAAAKTCLGNTPMRALNSAYGYIANKTNFMRSYSLRQARVIVAEEIDEIEIHVYPGEEVGALQDLSEKLWQIFYKLVSSGVPLSVAIREGDIETARVEAD
ncbi:hypothetical protein Tcan_01985 [Toxocara canis]|uniref:Uncharacterized protein n=1 Tax=Toxocara canis TaxID=6265 RepID=A0A0B2VMV3_TOXCA|nr:hypothetical protein Tcan_01985 [Toxocara canis]